MFFFFVCAAAQQIPIGNERGHGIGALDAPIVIDIFSDPLCPDSAAAQPIIEQVQAEYGQDKVRLVMHLFALPYHRNAFLACQALYVVEALNGKESWWPYLHHFFQVAQSGLWDRPTYNLTEREVWNLLYNAAVTAVGPVDKDKFIQHMDYSDTYNHQARIEWKYGTSLGVYGTPTFMVNGVTVPAADQTWTVEQWKELLDPLVAGKHDMRRWKHIRSEYRQRTLDGDYPTEDN